MLRNRTTHRNLLNYHYRWIRPAKGKILLRYSLFYDRNTFLKFIDLQIIQHFKEKRTMFWKYIKRAYREIELNINFFLKLLHNSVTRWTYLACFRLKLFSRFDLNPTVNSSIYREPDDVLIIKSGQRELPVIILGFEKLAIGRLTKRTIFLNNNNNNNDFI